jgi:hypothetical protein
MSHEMPLIRWAVRGEALQSRRRRGGRVASDGFRFQKLYALTRVTAMLDAGNGIAAVRWEGSQDVDVLFLSGREVYTQVKNEAGAKLTLDALGDVLASFALDLKESDKSELQFLFIANAGTLDAAVKRLQNGTPTDGDRQRIAGLLRQHDKSLADLPAPDLNALVDRLVGGLAFDVPSGHVQDGISSYEALAYRALSYSGLPHEKVKALINRLLRDLDTPGEMTRDQLLTLVHPSLSARGNAAMQPTRVRGFVKRSHIADSIARSIFGTDPVHVVLCGMGGCGKTQLAAAVAADERCEASYPDGVLWCVLGQTPNLLAVINSLLIALDTAPVMGDVDAGAALLRHALDKKRCALIIDDVWEPMHLLQMTPAGGMSRVIATARDRRVTTALAGTVIEVGAMTDEESLAVLKALHPPETAFDEVSAAAFASRVGHLPLALSLGAGRARSGDTYRDILKDLDTAEDSIRSLDEDYGRTRPDDADADARRLLSLEACFDISVRHLSTELRGVLRSLALLPEDERIDTEEAALLSGVSDVRVARRQLQTLETASLLLADGSDGPQRQKWYLHDLMRDYLASAHGPSRIGKPPLHTDGSLSEQHGYLIDRWGALARGCWADAPILGYVDRRLTWHAEMSGDSRVLDEVISQHRDKRPLWLERLQSKGESALFLADLERSISAGRASVQNGSAPLTGMKQLLRAAVARSCVVSKAKKIPPPLAARLVAEGRWPFREAYAKAQLLNPLTKAWTLGKLQPLVPPGDRQKLEDEIFQEMLQTTFLVLEETVLDAVIPNASADFRRRILQYAEGTKPHTHAVVLSHVAPWDPVRRGEWLTIFANRAFESPKQQKEAYTTLLKAGLVPPKADAVRLMSLLESPLGPVDVSFFASLIPLLPDELAIAGIKALSHNAASLLLPLALHRAIPFTEATLHALREHAIHARPPLMSAWMLAATADALASDERANAACEALALIRATPDSDWRKPHALLSASRALPTPIRTEVEVEAWSLAAEIGLDKLGVTDFARLTLDLTPGGLMRATEILKRQAPSTKIRCLPSLIRNSIPELIPDQVLDLADATRSHGGYGDLAPCIDRIPSEQLMLLYEICTELKIPTVGIRPDARPPEMGASRGSRDIVPQARFNPSQSPSRAEEFLKDTGAKIRIDLSVAECANIVASADNFDVAHLAQLVQALGPSLCEHFSFEEASELENLIALTLEIYR